MIAPKDSTSDTMRTALAFTIAALIAASELDLDRSEDDRAFFAEEKKDIEAHYHTVTAAEQATMSHKLLVAQVAQARIQIGDVVLDRGVSNGKARTKVELKGSSMEDGADHVFGANIRDITTIERSKEPNAVLMAVGKLNQVPDFPGKAELAADLTTRANNQAANFTQRNHASNTAKLLASAEDLAISNASDALYKLEKRLLERFPRQTGYVKAFFYDVAPARKKSNDQDDTQSGAPT